MTKASAYYNTLVVNLAMLLRLILLLLIFLDQGILLVVTPLSCHCFGELRSPAAAILANAIPNDFHYSYTSKNKCDNSQVLTGELTNTAHTNVSLSKQMNQGVSILLPMR